MKKLEIKPGLADKVVERALELWSRDRLGTNTVRQQAPLGVEGADLSWLGSPIVRPIAGRAGARTAAPAVMADVRAAPGERVLFGVTHALAEDHLQIARTALAAASHCSWADSQRSA